MKELVKWAPVGGAVCLIIAAFIIGRNSRRDVKEIYSMIDRYDKMGK